MSSEKTEHQNNDPDNAGLTGGATAASEDENGSSTSQSPHEEEELDKLGKLMLEMQDIINDEDPATDTRQEGEFEDEGASQDAFQPSAATGAPAQAPIPTISAVPALPNQPLEEIVVEAQESIPTQQSTPIISAIRSARSAAPEPPVQQSAAPPAEPITAPILEVFSCEQQLLDAEPTAIPPAWTSAPTPPPETPAAPAPHPASEPAAAPTPPVSASEPTAWPAPPAPEPTASAPPAWPATPAPEPTASAAPAWPAPPPAPEPFAEPTSVPTPPAPKPSSSQTKLNPFFALSERAASRSSQELPQMPLPQSAAQPTQSPPASQQSPPIFKTATPEPYEETATPPIAETAPPLFEPARPAVFEVAAPPVLPAEVTQIAADAIAPPVVQQSLPEALPQPAAPPVEPPSPILEQPPYAAAPEAIPEHPDYTPTAPMPEPPAYPTAPMPEPPAYAQGPDSESVSMESMAESVEEPEEEVDLRTLFSGDADNPPSPKTRSQELSRPSRTSDAVRRPTNSNVSIPTPADIAKPPQSYSFGTSYSMQSEQPQQTEPSETVDLRTLFSEDAAPKAQPEAYAPQLEAYAPQPETYAPQPETYAPQPEAYAPQPEAYAPQPETYAPQPEAYAPSQPQAYAPSQPPAYAPSQPQAYAPQPAFQPPSPADAEALRKSLSNTAELSALSDDDFKMTVSPEQLKTLAEQSKKPKARKTFLGLPAWGANNSLTGGGESSGQPSQGQKPRKTFFGLPTFGSNEAVNQPTPAPGEPNKKARKTLFGIPAIPLVENLFNREAPPAEPQPSTEQQPEFAPPVDSYIPDPNRQSVFDRAAQTASEFQEPGADDLAEWTKSAHYAFERGQFEVAERYYLRVLGIMETRSDLDDNQVITCMKNLGDVYFFLGKTEDAVDVFEQLASTMEQTPNETYLNIVVDLARAYGTIGKLTQGADLCMRAMQLAGDILPPGHELHGRLNTAYVNIVRRKADDTRAVDLTGAAAKTKTTERGVGLRSKVAVRLEPLDEDRNTRTYELMKSKDFLAMLNTVGLTVLISGIVLGTTQKFLTTVAATEQAKASAEYTGREYKTVDGMKSLRFDKDNNCYYWNAGKQVNAQYFAVGSSWLESFRLLAGCLRVKDIWFQAKGDRIIDGEGSTLYLPTAPENEVAKRMWWYAGFAGWHMKEHKSYPTDAGKWKDVAPDFYYTNPFNGKPDLPVFIQAKGAATPTAPLITANGAAWPRQPEARPGAIVALCLDYVRFFVRGYDRDGVLLSGNKPGKFFYIELRDGQNITQDELLKFKDKAELSQDPTPVRVYMTPDAGVANTLAFMKTAIPIGLWLLWLLSLGQSFVIVRLCDTLTKRLLAFAGIIIPTILLLMWYVVALGWI